MARGCTRCAGRERQLTAVPKWCIVDYSWTQSNILRRHAKAFFHNSAAMCWRARNVFVCFFVADSGERHPGARGFLRPERGGRYPGARGGLLLEQLRYRTSWGLLRPGLRRCYG
jgi:hypothetical protein